MSDRPDPGIYAPCPKCGATGDHNFVVTCYPQWKMGEPRPGREPVVACLRCGYGRPAQ